MIPKFGMRSLALLLATGGAFADLKCEGTREVDATYHFGGKFDVGFVEAVSPAEGCSLVLQTKGETVRTHTAAISLF